MLKFHHIGIASQNVEQDFQIFKVLGYRKSSKVFVDEQQKVKGFFIKAGSHPTLELLENLALRGPLTGVLKRKNKLYHMAFESDDIERDINRLIIEEKALIICPLMSATVFSRICFLLLPNGLVVELIEP